MLGDDGGAVRVAADVVAGDGDDALTVAIRIAWTRSRVHVHALAHHDEGIALAANTNQLAADKLTRWSTLT